MGCDIHDYCEIKTKNGWEMVREVFDNPYYDRKIIHPYNWRNYYLFGVLAGVSNENFPQICEPRGIPDDASEGYLKIVLQWSGDGHSHSWHLLSDLLNYPLYDEIVTRQGIVDSSNYRTFKENGKPLEWCAGVGGGATYSINNYEMEEYLTDPDGFINRRIKSLLYNKKLSWEKWNQNCPAYEAAKQDIINLENGILPTDIHFYTSVEWKESVRSCIGDRWFKVLDRLKELAPDGDYTKIRLVFFFDN